VILCTLSGRSSIAQVGAQPPDQQNGAAGASGASQACYLGGSGPVPGSAIRAAGMALPQSALSQMRASDGGSAQQASAGSTEQSAEDAQQAGTYSTDQSAAGQTSDQP
jgi:hypothetical protein